MLSRNLTSLTMGAISKVRSYTVSEFSLFNFQDMLFDYKESLQMLVIVWQRFWIELNATQDTLHKLLLYAGDIELN